MCSTLAVVAGARQLARTAKAVGELYKAAECTPLHIVAEVAILQRSSSEDSRHAQQLMSVLEEEAKTREELGEGVTFQMVVSYTDQPWRPGDDGVAVDPQDAGPD